MRLRSHLSIAAVLFIVVFSGAASAQDLSLDTNALGAGSASAKGRKAKPQNRLEVADPGAAKLGLSKGDKGASKGDKGAGKVDNRQFGELEGWSPGKSPPKKKEKEDDSPRFGRAPVNMNSSGGMGVGMPF
jgi:hypothetical protein